MCGSCVYWQVRIKSIRCWKLILYVIEVILSRNRLYCPSLGWTITSISWSKNYCIACALWQICIHAVINCGRDIDAIRAITVQEKYPVYIACVIICWIGNWIIILSASQINPNKLRFCSTPLNILYGCLVLIWEAWTWLGCQSADSYLG